MKLHRQISNTLFKIRLLKLDLNGAVNWLRVQNKTVARQERFGWFKAQSGMFLAFTLRAANNRSFSSLQLTSSCKVTTYTSHCRTFLVLVTTKYMRLDIHKLCLAGAPTRRLN